MADILAALWMVNMVDDGSRGDNCSYGNYSTDYDNAGDNDNESGGDYGSGDDNDSMMVVMVIWS